MNNEERKCVPLLRLVRSELATSKLWAAPGAFCAGATNSDPTGRASVIACIQRYYFLGVTMRFSSTGESLKGKFLDVEGKFISISCILLRNITYC
jgi:hypothetical protein